MALIKSEIIYDGKDDMAAKFGGWHRLWVFISAIYLVVVLVFSFNIFPEEKNSLIRVKAEKTIERLLEYQRNEEISFIITKLQKLTEKDKELHALIGFKASLDNGDKIGIDVIHLDDRTGPGRFNDEENKWKIGVKYNDKISAFPFGISKEEFFLGIKDFIQNAPFNRSPSEIIRSNYSDLSYKEIISLINNKYSTSINFSPINEEYKNKSEKLLLKFVLYTFAIWITPVIIIYVIGLSIAWVIRGFKSGKTGKVIK